MEKKFTYKNKYTNSYFEILTWNPYFFSVHTIVFLVIWPTKTMAVKVCTWNNKQRKKTHQRIIQKKKVVKCKFYNWIHALILFETTGVNLATNRKGDLKSLNSTLFALTDVKNGADAIVFWIAREMLIPIWFQSVFGFWSSGGLSINSALNHK